MFLSKLAFWRREEVQLLPVPPGEATLVFSMTFGQNFEKSFKGLPGIKPEDVARAYIKDWGQAGFFELNGKFENVRDVRNITFKKR